MRRRASASRESTWKGPLRRRGPFDAILARIPGKGGLTYVLIPGTLAPPITHAWARTPIRASVDGVAWDTSVWRAKTGEGFLPLPKHIHSAKSRAIA